MRQPLLPSSGGDRNGNRHDKPELPELRQNWKLGAGLGVGRCSSKSLRKRGSRMTPKERKDLPG